jgi:hypothetical protein
MKNNLIISGTKKDVQAIIGRLIEKYGAGARLGEVIEQEIAKYGEKGAILN